MNFLDTICQSILTWAMSNSTFAATFFMIIGVLRFVFKPLVTIITNYVKFTPNIIDDQLWSKITSSKGWIGFCFLVDWLLSIKLPKK